MVGSKIRWIGVLLAVGLGSSVRGGTDAALEVGASAFEPRDPAFGEVAYGGVLTRPGTRVEVILPVGASSAADVVVVRRGV